MPEPIIERLSRLTPDGSGLDRDSLLIAAGRASARPNRGWAVLSGLLGASQVLTLILLWPRPLIVPQPLAQKPSAVETQKSPAPAVVDKGNTTDQEAGILVARDSRLPPLTSVDHLVPPDPPLHALAAASGRAFE